MPPKDSKLMLGEFYCQADDGELYRMEHIVDAPIGNDPPDGSFGLHFDPYETLAIELDSKIARRWLMALYGWKASGHMRLRMIDKAFRKMGAYRDEKSDS